MAYNINPNMQSPIPYQQQQQHQMQMQQQPQMQPVVPVLRAAASGSRLSRVQFATFAMEMQVSASSRKVEQCTYEIGESIAVLFSRHDVVYAWACMPGHLWLHLGLLLHLHLLLLLLLIGNGRLHVGINVVGHDQHGLLQELRGLSGHVRF